MRYPENILAVASLAPEYMGFIFYQGSRRFVGDDFAVPSGFPSVVKRVGVFVNQGSREILRLAKKHDLEFVQLHGGEPVKQCDELKKNGLKIIKAFGVSNDFNFSDLAPYKKIVHYFLFDTKGKSHGGTGLSFDWEMLTNYNQEVPFFLSGGISGKNIQGVEKLKSMNLHAVDLNSGVETEAGLKDLEMIRKLRLKIKD